MKNIFNKIFLCTAVLGASFCLAKSPMNIEKYVQMNVAANYYDCTVIHHPRCVTNGGEIVELTDGTSWLISPSHRSRTLNWWTDDVVVIKQNPNIFSDINSFTGNYISNRVMSVIEIF